MKWCNRGGIFMKWIKNQKWSNLKWKDCCKTKSKNMQKVSGSQRTILIRICRKMYICPALKDRKNSMQLWVERQPPCDWPCNNQCLQSFLNLLTKSTNLPKSNGSFIIFLTKPCNQSISSFIYLFFQLRIILRDHDWHLPHHYGLTWQRDASCCLNNAESYGSLNSDRGHNIKLYM